MNVVINFHLHTARGNRICQQKPQGYKSWNHQGSASRYCECRPTASAGSHTHPSFQIRTVLLHPNIYARFVRLLKTAAPTDFFLQSSRSKRGQADRFRLGCKCAAVGRDAAGGGISGPPPGVLLNDHMSTFCAMRCCRNGVRAAGAACAAQMFFPLRAQKKKSQTGCCSPASGSRRSKWVAGISALDVSITVACPSRRKTPRQRCRSAAPVDNLTDGSNPKKTFFF